MANDILVKEQDDTPQQVVFRDSTDFGPAAATDLRHVGGSPLYGQLDMTDVANNNARQSAKVDLGANRALMYICRGSCEFAATPTAGARVEVYWAPSAHSTAANGNPGGTTGSDAAYSGVDSDLTNSLKQLIPIGSLTTTDDPTTVIQSGVIGWLVPPTAYGMLVVVDYSGAAFHSDAVETHFVLDPWVPAVQ